MSKAEKRTLQIRATLDDLMTRPLRTMAKVVMRTVKFGMVAPFKLLFLSLKGVYRLLKVLPGITIAAFAVFRGGQTIGAVIDAADAMSKLARSTNTSTESISELETAFKFGGLSIEQFGAIITGLGRGMSAAINNIKSIQGDAFNQLGVSLETLKNGNAVEIFGGIAKGLEQYNTQAEKAAVLQKLFPDNFLKLIDLLGKGEEAFLKTVDAARDYGATLDTDLGEAAESFNDELLKLKTSLVTVAREGILKFAQQFEPIITLMADFIRINKEGISNMLALGLELLSKVLVGLVKAIGYVLANLPKLGRELNKAFAFVLPESAQGIVSNIIQKAFPQTTQEMDDLADRIVNLREKLEALPTTYAEVQRAFAQPGMAKEIFNTDAASEVQMQRYWETQKNGAAAYRGEIAKLQENLQQLGRLQDQGVGTVDEFGKATASATADMASKFAEMRKDHAGLLEDYEKGIAGLGKVSGTKTRRPDSGAEPTPAEGPGEAKSEWSEFWKNFEAGVSDATKRWTQFEQAAREAGAAVVDAVGNGIEDAFTDLITGVKNWKEAWKDAARSILEDIARIISKLITMKILEGFAVSTASNSSGSSSGGAGTNNPGSGGLQVIPAQIGRAPSPGPANSPGGDTFIIYAMDSQDVSRTLLKGKDTMRALHLNDLSTNTKVQAAVKTAARR